MGFNSGFKGLRPLSWAYKWPAVRFVVACSPCTMVLATYHIHRLLAQALGNQRKETRHWHQLETVTDKGGSLTPLNKW